MKQCEEKMNEKDASYKRMNGMCQDERDRLDCIEFSPSGESMHICSGKEKREAQRLQKCVDSMKARNENRDFLRRLSVIVT